MPSNQITLGRVLTGLLIWICEETRDTGKAPRSRVQPGEILREEFLKPLGISAYELAKHLRVPAPRVNDIVLERRGISADTTLRLPRLFGTTEQFWLNLQSAYEVSRVMAQQAPKIERIQPRAASVSR
jgi:addiction module HigA family antidote